jgi:hypothetical protein
MVEEMSNEVAATLLLKTLDKPCVSLFSSKGRIANKSCLQECK